jgi:hypothetical protein
MASSSEGVVIAGGELGRATAQKLVAAGFMWSAPKWRTPHGQAHTTNKAAIIRMTRQLAVGKQARDPGQLDLPGNQRKQFDPR